MSLVKDTAIVLRRLDFSETSQVLAMFTREHGQQRIIAKGVKRGTKVRPGVGLDLLELGVVVFSMRAGREDSLSTMTEWQQLDAFAHLRRDLACSYAGQFAAEVTAQLTEVHDPHADLFDGLAAMLARLRAGSALSTLVGYLRLLVREIGLMPDWSRCTNCARPTLAERAVYFSSRQGGAICRDCEPAMVEKRQVAGATLRLLDAPEPIVERAAPEAFDVLEYHLREIMARPARVSLALRSALGLPPTL